MITVAMLAILLGLAAPSLRHLQLRWELLQTAHLLESSLSLARSEAVRRAGKVAVRKSDVLCKPVLAETQWSCGWVVFNDLNGDGQQTDNEETLQTIDLSGHTQVEASWSSGVLRLNRYGGVLQGGSQHFVMTHADLSGLRRTLCFHQTGRLRLQEGGACT